MDFFTHVIIGYIISSLASGSPFNEYVVLGTLMAVLPDFDFILTPLGKRLPLMGHRGITHTAIFIILSTLLIYSIYSFSIGQWDTRLLLIMLTCGASHILGDFISYSGIPLLYPWVKSYSKLNLDMSINPLVFLMVPIFLIFLNYANSGRVPFISYQMAIYILGTAYILYFFLRVAMKRHYSQKLENRNFIAIPTWNPFSWRFACRLETPEEIRVTIKMDETIKIYKIPKTIYPVLFDDCQDMMSTYWHPKVQEFLHLFEFPYYQLKCHDGRKEIYWHAAEVGEIVSIKAAWQDGRLLLRTQGKIELPFPTRRHLSFDLPGW